MTNALAGLDLLRALGGVLGGNTPGPLYSPPKKELTSDQHESRKHASDRKQVLKRIRRLNAYDPAFKGWVLADLKKYLSYLAEGDAPGYAKRRVWERRG